MLNVNNRNTKKRQDIVNGVIVNLKYNSPLFLVFLLLALNS